MTTHHSLYSQIPATDRLLRDPRITAVLEQFGHTATVDMLRQLQDDARRHIQAENALPGWCVAWEQEVERRLSKHAQSALRPVINLTGTVLHTNLGRACLSDRALAAARGVSQGYSTLEYDLTAGERGQRYAHVEPLLCRLTGAEAAMVVNNNAAAVLLILSALTAGGEVITSRGELVEIGGSFRMPDVMAACGAVLREVGSTNKTRLSDYANAISEQTRALLKVHTSNYRIVGFTESVSPAALAELGRSRSIPVIEDLGSGCLVDLAPLGLRDEPTVQASVKAGVDVLSFSGDKLLGGPQAGIIVGKRHCIDLLKRHPLARALRVDKLTLAALEATLQAYADGTALQEIPVLSMLAQTPEELRQQAESLCRRMGGIGVTVEVVSTENPVGGGAVPTQTLPSFAVAVAPRDSAAALEAQLRQRPVPIIVRIAHDRCLLDMRTLFPADLDEILQAFRETAS